MRLTNINWPSSLSEGWQLTQGQLYGCRDISVHFCSLSLSWAEKLRESVKFSAHKSGLLLVWAENFRNKLLLSSLSSAQERRFALIWVEKISKQGVIICPWGVLHQLGQTGIEHAPWNVSHWIIPVWQAVGQREKSKLTELFERGIVE